MPTHADPDESALLADDHAFLGRSQEMFESMGAFVLARVFEGERLPKIAGEVLLYRDGGFQRVEEIYRQCASHGWNSQIYEAWAYITAQNVRSTAKTLGPLGGEALLIYAQSLEPMDVTRSEAIEAIEEAQEALYGMRMGVLL
jgi:hypothetical protein